MKAKNAKLTETTEPRIAPTYTITATDPHAAVIMDMIATYYGAVGCALEADRVAKAALGFLKFADGSKPTRGKKATQTAPPLIGGMQVELREPAPEKPVEGQETERTEFVAPELPALPSIPEIEHIPVDEEDLLNAN